MSVDGAWSHGIKEPMDKIDNIVDYSRYFEPSAGQQAWNGYTMSVDGAWSHGNKGTKQPQVLATTRQLTKSNPEGWGYGAHSLVGADAIDYIQRHAPTFICDGAASYGSWCDDSGSPNQCSAYIAWKAGHWQTTISALGSDHPVLV